MKLTPEQKVFIEYGKAKKALEIAKKQLAKEMRRYLSRHAVHGETTDDAWKPTGKWQIP